MLVGDVAMSYIAKKLKGRSSKILREEFPHLKEWGTKLFPCECGAGVGGSTKVY